MNIGKPEKVTDEPKPIRIPREWFAPRRKTMEEYLPVRERERVLVRVGGGSEGASEGKKTFSASSEVDIGRGVPLYFGTGKELENPEDSEEYSAWELGEEIGRVFPYGAMWSEVWRSITNPRGVGTEETKALIALGVKKGYIVKRVGG